MLSNAQRWAVTQTHLKAYLEADLVTAKKCRDIIVADIREQDQSERQAKEVAHATQD